MPSDAHPPSLADEFALARGQRGFSRVVGPFWCDGEGASDAYVAALALAATVHAGRRSALLSAYVMRFGPTEPDRVDIVTTLIRAGRASAAVRADVVQHGAVRAVAEAWLVEPALLLAVASDADDWPPPEACPPAEPSARTEVFEERLVTTSGLPRRSERWARGLIPAQSHAAWTGQLEHVLLLGDHLLPRGREPGVALEGTPLDLAISWYCAPERGWLRLRTDEDDLGGGFVTRSATVWSRSGHVVARARGTSAKTGRPSSDITSVH